MRPNRASHGNVVEGEPIWFSSPQIQTATNHIFSDEGGNSILEPFRAYSNQ